MENVDLGGAADDGRHTEVTVTCKTLRDYKPNYQNKAILS